MLEMNLKRFSNRQDSTQKKTVRSMDNYETVEFVLDLVFEK